MKAILATLSVITHCLAAELRYTSGGAYLVLQPGATNAPRTVQPQNVAISSENQQVFLGKKEEGVAGIYYVQVPEERLQNLRAFQPISFQQSSLTSQSSARYTQNPNEEKAQYKHEAAQFDSEYLPITVVTADQFAQYRQLESSKQQTQSSFNYQEQRAGKQQDTSNQEYSGRQQLPQDQTKGYLASIRYSEVKPINPPIYSYSPQSLVRVLRYASQQP